MDKIPDNSIIRLPSSTEDHVNYLSFLGHTRNNDYRVMSSPLNWIIELNSVTSSITASTTQTQGQQALQPGISHVTTVANENDVVTLPDAKKHQQCLVINSGANTLQIFPSSGDDLGGGADSSAFLLSNSSVKFICYSDGSWVPLS